jgi:hypothetical protein
MSADQLVVTSEPSLTDKIEIFFLDIGKDVTRFFDNVSHSFARLDYALTHDYEEYEPTSYSRSDAK